VPDLADQPDRLKAVLADRYRIERELYAGGMATVPRRGPQAPARGRPQSPEASTRRRPRR
jgi:hypothetical protein